MSGFSNSIECPNCGSATADLYQDYKPFDYINIQCLECGLIISPSVDYMTLKNLNDIRRDMGLPLIKKKPKQNKDLW